MPSLSQSDPDVPNALSVPERRRHERLAWRDHLHFSWRRWRQWLRQRLSARRGRAFPLSGHRLGRPIPLVEQLTDDQLAELNAILDWNSFVVDSRGRRFGRPSWHDKGSQPQSFPNRRTLAMHEAFNLSGCTVLEVGCFEGMHTLGLCELGARVTAIDSRVENVVKAIVRTSMYDHHPRIAVCDVERPPLPTDLLSAEYCHHVGVLYHLKDPVSHLRDLGGLISRGILLDTHYALDTEATEQYQVDGEWYPFRRYGEFGYEEVLSGMYDHAKWLPLPTILMLLQRAGFDQVLKVEPRMGTQGPRVLILARKS